MYRRYGIVISISRKVEEHLLTHLNESKRKKFLVIENGINLTKIQQANKISRISLGYNQYDKLIIMVARFSQQKDQQTLIRSMLLLPEYQ